MILFEFDASALSVVERRKVSDKFDQTEEQSVLDGTTIKVFTNHPECIETPAGCVLTFRSDKQGTPQK